MAERFEILSWTTQTSADIQNLELSLWILTQHPLEQTQTYEEARLKGAFTLQPGLFDILVHRIEVAD
jgi:hypothetical protein